MGDEWWYEHSGIKASADRVPYGEECSDCAIVIKYLYRERGKLTERKLIKFLSNTKSEFGDTNIVIKYQNDKDSSSNGIPYQSLLESLSEKQYIQYRVNSVSNSSIECIRKYVHPSNNVIELSVSNKRVGWFV